MHRRYLGLTCRGVLFTLQAAQYTPHCARSLCSVVGVPASGGGGGGEEEEGLQWERMCALLYKRWRGGRVLFCSLLISLARFAFSVSLYDEQMAVLSCSKNKRETMVKTTF